MGKPPPQKLLFMKNIQKVANRLLGGNPLSQPPIHIVGFLTLTLSLKNRKMLLNRLGKTQSPEGPHHQGKSPEGGHEDFRCILN
jgi:hypothetical protein